MLHRLGRIHDYGSYKGVPYVKSVVNRLAEQAAEALDKLVVAKPSRMFDFQEVFPMDSKEEK